jgi:RimJ/RimL family protein N-acetyltransferase
MTRTPVTMPTKRLLLRPWRPADRAPFAALNADPRVMEYFPTVLDRADSDALADRCQRLIDTQGWGFWAVEHRQTGAFLGMTGLNVPSAELPCSPCVEIGWRFAHPHWRQGFATEAALCALNFGFERLALTEIVAFTAVGNQRSRAVMTRLGMHDAHEPFDHPAIAPDSPLRRLVLYRLSRTQWLADTPS